MSSNYMQNREVSWLRFNDRVLSEALEDNVAAYEKLKFISIFVSNLDEFFMMRVGSLHDMALLKKQIADSKTGMLPKEQIDAILKMLPDMYRRKDEIYKNVMEELEQYNIREYEFSQLDEHQVKFIESYYKKNIKPLLFAQIIDDHHPFPFINNSVLSVIVELEKDGENTLGMIEVPQDILPFILLPGDAIDFVLAEKIVYAFADQIFNGYSIKSKSIIKVTRNFDLDANSEMADEFDDYKDKMKNILKKRKRQSAVRLESDHGLPHHILKILLENLSLDERAYFYTDRP